MSTAFVRRHSALAGAIVVVGSLIAVLIAVAFPPDTARPPGRIDVLVSTPIPSIPSPILVAPEREYIEIVTSCGAGFGGACVNARTGPTTSSPVAMKLRRGIVLLVVGTIERDGHTWYKVAFDEWLRYPERTQGNLYVAADFVRSIRNEGPIELSSTRPQTNKHILVDRSSQILYAYEGDILIMKQPVSTGIELTPTPRGTFTIYKKTPSRYMQGPIPGISTHYYDLPGVPWNLYFTQQGAVIHGAYWHNDFGRPHSNGCVNLPVDAAEKLYEWADVGTSVTVRD